MSDDEPAQVEDAEDEDPEIARARPEISRRARNKNLRVAEFSRDRPTHWCPWKVLSPAGLPFTEPGAWQFIADLADAGHPIQIVRLMKPLGELGFVMIAKGAPDHPDIYIKVQLGGNGSIIGRSFHNDES